MAAEAFVADVVVDAVEAFVVAEAFVVEDVAEAFVVADVVVEEEEVADGGIEVVMDGPILMDPTTDINTGPTHFTTMISGIRTFTTIPEIVVG